MARTSTAVSRSGAPASPSAGPTSPARLARTWAVLVGLLLSGAVCAGLFAGGAPMATTAHRAISTASGQTGGSAGTEQRQRAPSRRTQSQSQSKQSQSQQSQARSATRADRTVQAATRATHLTRPTHGATAARGYTHGSGTAHPTAWAVSTDRPDSYGPAGHASTDRDRIGHAPAVLGGTGVRAPPGPHAA
ncbi:hypothetical protein [Actinopolymorpha singaporensis]|uniref:Uncharacterized protein n=1 Tax=Actinopolymorpha singaporensis TaxID=117157 RepID=A0A1H1LYN4_9ACTN|nr:hypothetical protein [Actinopolymorpha singaporensis]SDR79728.1 hypothetical protein SAMN04489717_0603 [Actinopolymorpha singaporensis]